MPGNAKYLYRLLQYALNLAGLDDPGQGGLRRLPGIQMDYTAAIAINFHGLYRGDPACIHHAPYAQSRQKGLAGSRYGIYPGAVGIGSARLRRTFGAKQGDVGAGPIGIAPVSTPVTNAPLVCRTPLDNTH